MRKTLKKLVICQLSQAIPLRPGQTLMGRELRWWVKDLDSTIDWVLSNPGVEVVHPAELRERVRLRAEAVAALHRPARDRCYSPDGEFRLEVESHTQLSESGPVTYATQDFTLRVFDSSNQVRLLHTSCRAWDDGENSQVSGLHSWAFRADGLALQLQFMDGTVQEVLIPEAETPRGDEEFWNAG